MRVLKIHPRTPRLIITIAAATLSMVASGTVWGHGRGSSSPEMTIHSGANFDISLSGEPGGRRDASTAIDSSCVGSISRQPNHRIRLASDMDNFALRVESDQDTTLVVQSSDGVRCNDDSDGLNPVLDESWRAGSYDIYVGTYHGGRSGSYTLHMEASRRGRRQARLDTGANDSVHGDGTLDGRRRRRGRVELAGVSGGTIDTSYLSRRATGSCEGYTAAKPSHLVTLARDFQTVDFAVDGRGASLVVATPSGQVLCNSDRGVSTIRAENLSSGTYRVWIPSRRERVANDYTLTVGVPRRERSGQMLFDGRFEATDVTFSGRDAQEVQDECTAFASTTSLSWVDEIQVGNQTHRRSGGYWSADALCAIAAANAAPRRGECGATIRGSIESTPFAFCATDDEELASLVTRLVPNLVGSWVDEMVINGQAIRSSSGYWNERAVTAILLNNTPEEGARLQASGTIESVPFAFSAETAHELRSTCESFWSNFNFSWADEMVINGQSRRARGYWSAPEACMIVSSVAQEGSSASHEHSPRQARRGARHRKR